MSQQNVQQRPSIPSWMVGGQLFTGAVEVLADPVLKKDRDSGEMKTSKGFPGLTAFMVPVEYLRGVRQKTMQDGAVRELPVFDTVTVTVWASTKPQVTTGDYARLLQPMVGGTAQGVYIQALGLNVVEPKAKAA